MLVVETIAKIRRAYFVQKKAIKEICRELKVSRKSVRRVVRGEQLGRRLGFPTANLRLKRRRSPLGGIFAVRVRGVADAPWPGVASLGTRPTVDGIEPWLETFLFDFATDLYGREIEVEFVAKIRDELRFQSLDAMVARMHEDANEARRVLAP